MPIANQRVADRHGLSLQEARDKGLYQTLLWGTDKGCFPGPRSEPQCWLIPDAPSPHNVWGPRTNNGEPLKTRFVMMPDGLERPATPILPHADERTTLGSVNTNKYDVEKIRPTSSRSGRTTQRDHRAPTTRPPQWIRDPLSSIPHKSPT